MAELITETYYDATGLVKQCDILKNVECIEYAIEEGDYVEISKIHFPYIIVLTQACDLQQNYNAKNNVKLGKGNQDKYLISVIVAPVYNFVDFLSGEHLKQLGMKMEVFPSRSKTPTKNIIANENKRYHYLKFDDNVNIVESVIDFKHYFTVSLNYLNDIYKTNYICSISLLYRENISQRFANYLARIGLPDVDKK